MLTATIWGYFASLQNYGEIASAQAGMIDKPALSYGLFHLQGKPNKLYGLVTTGFTMQGLNMDIGHLRHIRWVNDDNPQSAINNKPELTQNGKSAAQNRWIAYNKMRGQHNSAMEHAAPEAFWIDKTTCRYTDANGQIQNPVMDDCAQAISAVKALSLAQRQGQKIYTITQANRDTALPSLPVGGTVGSEIRAAVQAGMEVTVHANTISANGWTGYGYTILDPETGVGAFLIEGGGNGGDMQNGATRVFNMLGYSSEISLIGSDVVNGALFVTTKAIQKTFDVLNMIWQCYAEAIISIILVAVMVAFVVAAFILGGPALGPAVAALISVFAMSTRASASTGSYGCSEASCQAHYLDCLETSLADAVGGNFGQTRCELCRETCVQNNGEWRGISHTGDRCDYWNFQ